MTKRKHHRLAISIISLAVITMISGLLIPHIENSYVQNPNITNAEDGIWWAVTTATSVGYGDTYPMSLPGRIIGMVVQIVGVTVYGIIISLVTISLFRKEQQHYWIRTTERFDRIEEKLDQIKSTQSFEIKKK